MGTGESGAGVSVPPNALDPCPMCGILALILFCIVLILGLVELTGMQAQEFAVKTNPE